MPVPLSGSLSAATKFLVAAAITLAVGLVVVAQPPSNPSGSGFPQLELPAEAVVPQMPEKGNSGAVENRIRKVLSGDANGETGDPVLDDILGVLKKRGSILKGSMLDSPNPGNKGTVDQNSNRYRAAELLLKTSRCLEKVGSLAPTQRDLIKKMRIEATQLMNSITPTAPSSL